MQISPKGYRFLVPLLLPLAVLYLLWRARKQPDYLKYWSERFAWGSFPAPRVGHPRIWIHAVSVGETNATRPLVQAILKKWPQCDILLTHMTPTGRDTGRKIVELAPDRIQQAMLPYDAVFAVRQFLRQTQPLMGIVMETEVWPTLLEEARVNQIPMVLANARLSEKSYNQAMKFESVMRDAMGKFSKVCAQSQKDADRLLSLGTVEPEVVGSLKFDIQPPKKSLLLASDWKSQIKEKILLMASTRDGEEQQFIDAIEAFRKEVPSVPVKYLLVPRHPQRFAEVEQMLKKSSLRYQKRSELTSVQDLKPETDVIFGDTMGEMFFFCALADVTLMGGSYENFGCQNVIEPASVGVPVIVGPYTFNFATVVERAIEMGAIEQVKNAKEGVVLAHAWLANDQELANRKANALAFSQAYVGATERHMRVLEHLWSK